MKIGEMWSVCPAFVDNVLFFMQLYHWFTFFAYITIIIVQKNIFGSFCKEYFLYTNLGIDFLIKSLTSDRLQYFSLFNS